MAVFISKQEVERMKKHIIDPATGMSEFDLFEWEHCYEDWEVL